MRVAIEQASGENIQVHVRLLGGFGLGLFETGVAFYTVSHNMNCVKEFMRNGQKSNNLSDKARGARRAKASCAGRAPIRPKCARQGADMLRKDGLAATSLRPISAALPHRHHDRPKSLRRFGDKREALHSRAMRAIGQTRGRRCRHIQRTN